MAIRKRRVDQILRKRPRLKTRRKIAAAIAKSHTAGAAHGAELVGGEVLRSAGRSFATARYPDLIKGLAASSREVVQGMIQKGIDDGLGPDALARKLEERYGSWVSGDAGKQARSELIARTETATAYNKGAVGQYREQGVTEVEVFDGEQDEACAAARGAIWTLEEAESDPIAHPNCVRSFTPHVP